MRVNIPEGSAAYRWFSPAFCTAAAITVLAALLRFFHLGRESIWLDEAISIWLARLNWHSLRWELYTYEANMALYYLFLHFWIALGESEVVVRSLSALAGVLTIPPFYSLCQRVSNARVALIASFLLATNTFHIQYSQEARAYSLVVLLTVLSSLTFVRAIERRSRIDWVWYVAVGTSACYSHFFAVLVLGAQWVSLLVLDRREVPWKRFGLSAASIGILCSPLVVCILNDKSEHLSWVPRPTLSGLYFLLVKFAGGNYRVLIVGFSAAILSAMFFAIRDWRNPKSRFDNWHFVFLFSWLFLPVLFTFGVSLWKPLFIDRFLIVSLPAFVMLAAVGLSRISSKWIMAGVLTIIAIWEIRSFRTYESRLVKQDWRGASTLILSQETRADGLFFYPRWTQDPFDYYARLEGRTGDVGTVLQPERDSSGRTVPPDLSERFPKIWLIESNLYDRELTQEADTIRATLSDQYSDVAERSFLGVDVLMYSGSKGARTSR